MIFVAVREHNRGDGVFVFVEKVKIRNRDIDAVSSLLGKAHPGVENQHLVAVTHRHTVHSKLADAAEWNDLKDTSHRFVVYHPRYDYQTNNSRNGPFNIGYERVRSRDHARRLLPHRRR